MKAPGVYGIRCRINGKLYVGSAARTIEKRWGEHLRSLRRGDHWNRYLQAAWHKHGEAAFEFIVLELCEPADCVAREQFWIDRKNATDHAVGYNLSPTAGSILGVKMSPQVGAQTSARLRGKRLSAETRARMSLAHSNPSEEYRARMSAAKRGETRSPETRAKMSAAKKGRKVSDEARANIGAASRGRRHTDEAKAKMSAGHKGRKKSAETRARMSEATRLVWAARRQARQSAAPILPFMLEDAP